MRNAAANIYTDFKQLADLKREARQISQQALEKVAKQFEAVFLQMMLKQMRQASMGDPIFNSNGLEFYREMHDQQLTMHLSDQGSIGIADLLVRQLGQSSLGSRPTDQALAAYRSQVQAGDDSLSKPIPETGNPENATGNQSIKAFSSNTTAIDPLPGRFDSPRQFIQALLPEARKAADHLGVDPKLLLAQAALETGWGQKIIHHSDGRSSHNLFNIKAGRSWTGERVGVGTLEYEKGVAVQKRADFRSYRDYRQSFSDYVALLHQPRYRQALQQAANPQGYLEALQQAGYATDPAYADKIMAIYQRQTLAAL